MFRWFTSVLAVPATLTLTLTAFEQPAITTIRAVTTAPDQYANRAVTLTGRFRGRPISDRDADVRPVNRSRWDFLLTSTDNAAVWISGVRPAWWDIELNPRSIADSNSDHWLEVTGTVRIKRSRGSCARRTCSQVWIEASDLRPTMPVSDGVERAVRSPLLAPTVVFNDPIADERDVSRSTTVRLQFSRHMIPETFSEHVRVSYSSLRQLSAPAIPQFTAVYQDDTRSLELRFTAALNEYETVKIELLGGISARNGLALQPWVFAFTTGE